MKNSWWRKLPPELRLVILFVVIGLLSALGMVGSSNPNRPLQSDRARAETQMSFFEMLINRYALAHRELPSNLDFLTENDPRTGEPVFAEIPLDPWGRVYEYRILSDTEFRLFSSGQDCQEGTADDVVWPPEE